MIQRVAVVGAGTMGAGIAQLCAQSGFAVKVFDALPAALAAFPARLKKSIDGAVLRGKLTTMQGDRAYHSVSTVERLEDLAGADLVIEAVSEDLALKQDLFARLSKACPDALLATNTSSLSVARIMAKAEGPERTMGLHFFNPPVAMKLVEMVRTDATSPECFRHAWDFVLTGLRRTPVDVRDTPGFIVNRVLRPYYVTSQKVVLDTAGFASVDAACKELGGVPMGPFELLDLIGLDVNFAITTAIYEQLGRPERFTPPQMQRILVEKKMLGRKTGKGFYNYVDGKPNGENPEAARLLKASNKTNGIEAWNAIRTAIIKEAELVVSEKTATPGDVDVAVKLAMNFPKGPFEWRKESTA